MFIVITLFMRSVFIFILAFLAFFTGYGQDVARNSYPATLDSGRIQASAAVTGYMPAISGSIGRTVTGTNVVMTLPAKWASRPVRVDIYNEKGRLIRLITEKKASPFIVVSLEGIPLGAYELRTSCGKETNSQVTIVAGHS
ncbi:MAG TPA: hypothetical protein VGD35_05385 [Chitinophaga sp.]